MHHKSNSFKVIPQPSGFVAEIQGVNLREKLSQEMLDRINAAWLEHGVVFFADQDMDPSSLEAFTESMGGYGKTDFVLPIEGHPNVLELRREPEETAFHFGSAWHCDGSYQAAPAAATILFGHIIPPIGGDTLFADGQRAYQALPEKMKVILADLKAIHSASAPYSSDGYYGPNDDPSRSMKVIPSDEASEMYTHHPIIRTHPETGAKVLWMSPIYMPSIVGLDEEESSELMDFLVEFTTRDEFVYRHKWKKNMLILWYNRRVQHFAEAGFDGHRRVMWRTTTAGTVPV